MALNSSSINSRALNGSAASSGTSTGGGVVVSMVQIVNGLGTSVSNIAQLVASKSTAGVNATFNQIVTFQATGSTTVTVQQLVTSKGTLTPLAIDQSVVAVSEPTTFFGRNGYEPRIYIANVLVTGLHGEISCTFTEGDTPQLKFTIIPPTGSQDIRSYRGKVVSMKIREASGITQIYSGKINTPDVKIIDQMIEFNCSLDIDQVVNNTFARSELDKIGYYNNEVFSKPKTTLQELRDRVSTVPKVIQIDRSGTVDVVDIAPKGTADHTLTNGDVYRQSITFKFSSGQRYINKVNIKVNYTYQRLHHQEVSYSTSAPHSSVCGMLTNGYTPLTRELVYSAVNSSGWPVKRDIGFTPIYPGGYYRCGDATVGWSTVSCTGVTTVVTDKDGNPVLNDGKQQYEYEATACTNIATSLCIDAYWTATNRYAQNIANEYTLTVNAPQSQSDFGIKEKDENFSFSDGYNSAEWEDYEAYTSNIPTGLSKAGTSGGSFWINAKTDERVFNTSVDIMLNKAKSDILKTHRDDRVVFTRSLWTAVTLKNTVFLNTDRVTAKGKVYSYTHKMDIDTGKATTLVELALSRSTGSATDSELSIPAAPSSTPIYTAQVVTLPGHYGEDPDEVSNSGSWVGHIANKLIVVAVGGLDKDYRMTQFPVRFIYDTPSVDNTLRLGSDLSTSASYDVAIPDDTLTVNFTDTNYE